MRRLPSLVVALAALSLTGCSSYGIKQPTCASVQAGSTPFRIEWTGGNMSNFTATLDGTSVASRFAIGDSSATATIPVTAGSHTVATTADVYDPVYRKAIARSGSVTFTATAPAASVGVSAPANAQGARGAALPITVTVTRSGTSAPVSVSATGPAISSPGVTISGASGSLTLTVKTDAPFGVSQVTIEGSATGASPDSTTLSLRVLRATGAFASAGFAVTTGGQTATSNDGAVTVAARTGAQEGLPSAFAAVFRRGTVALGNAIGYNHGATNQPNGAYGGAGFCTASSAGFVIAGRGPGVVTPASAQFAAFFLDFQTSRQSPQTDVASFRSAYYFQPRVWFSQDCSVAIVAGAHPVGPVNNLAQVIDVARGAFLGSFEFAVPTFTAAVTTTASGTQQVTFTADGQARPPIALP